MDLDKFQHNIATGLVTTLTGGFTLAGMNMLEKSEMVTSKGDNGKNIVLGVAVAGFLAATYAEDMEAVQANPFAVAAVQGVKTACGLKSLHSVANMGTGLQKDGTNKPARVSYSLGTIPTAEDWNLQGAAASDEYDSLLSGQENAYDGYNHSDEFDRLLS